MALITHHEQVHHVVLGHVAILGNILHRLWERNRVTRTAGGQQLESSKSQVLVLPSSDLPPPNMAAPVPHTLPAPMSSLVRPA